MRCSSLQVLKVRNNRPKQRPVIQQSYGLWFFNLEGNLDEEKQNLLQGTFWRRGCKAHAGVVAWLFASLAKPGKTLLACENRISLPIHYSPFARFGKEILEIPPLIAENQDVEIFQYRRKIIQVRSNDNIPFAFIERASKCNKSTYVCLQKINGCVCSSHIWISFKKRFSFLSINSPLVSEEGFSGFLFIWSTELGNFYIPEQQKAPRCFTYFCFYPTFTLQVTDT